MSWKYSGFMTVPYLTYHAETGLNESDITMAICKLHGKLIYIAISQSRCYRLYVFLRCWDKSVVKYCNSYQNASLGEAPLGSWHSWIQPLIHFRRISKGMHNLQWTKYFVCICVCWCLHTSKKPYKLYNCKVLLDQENIYIPAVLPYNHCTGY
jgi:hypothetical protein